MKKSSRAVTIVTMQDAAVLNQVAPVQNTWYEVLAATRNVKVFMIATEVLTAGETIELRVTIDGVEFLGTEAQTADTAYQWNWEPVVPIATSGLCLGVATTGMFGLNMEGKSVTVEVRKITAAGAGNLQAIVVYGIMA